MSSCIHFGEPLMESAEDDEFVILIEETKKPDKEELLKKSKKSHTVDEFEILNFIGEGSYAKVVEAIHKETKDTFALKIVLKKHVRKVFFFRLVVEKRISN